MTIIPQRTISENPSSVIDSLTLNCIHSAANLPQTPTGAVPTVPPAEAASTPTAPLPPVTATVPEEAEDPLGLPKLARAVISGSSGFHTSPPRTLTKPCHWDPRTCNAARNTLGPDSSGTATESRHRSSEAHAKLCSTGRVSNTASYRVTSSPNFKCFERRDGRATARDAGTKYRTAGADGSIAAVRQHGRPT